MIKKYLIILFCVLNLLSVAKADIPIIAYGGIPDKYSSTNRYREFKEAGFDIMIESYGGRPTNSMIKKLNDAQKAGIKLILASNQLLTNPQNVINSIKNHPSLYAYFLCDEPKPSNLNELYKQYQLIKRYDPNTPCYINLFPNYGERSLNNHGIHSYQQYLEEASSLGLPQLSFDHYPITTSGIRSTWYSNLEAVRKESIKTNKPFWAFVLCTPHYIYPQPTLSMLRLQIYSNLAYGAKAIQYFTYWTPEPDGHYDYHDGPISSNGRRTKTYNLVKEMNSELHNLIPLFDGSEIISVKHLGRIPDGGEKAKKMPQNIKKLKINANEGSIVSLLKKNNNHYLLIVNKDYKESIRLTIKAEPSVVRITKSLLEEKIKTTYSIPAGDILIFKLD